MATAKRRRLKGLSINKMLPNVLTVLALCAGLTAMRYGLQERWEAAVAFVIAAGVLDGLDGRIARILGSASKFGAEMDSLSDVIAFGVAPAFLVYLWTMHDAGNPGWILALMFTACCALRLARFNTMADAPKPPWAYNFFTGVPAPAGAGLALLPMILYFWSDFSFLRQPVLNAAVLLAVSGLMVSRVPTYSFKSVRVPIKFVLPMLLIVTALAASILSSPWATFSIIGVAYVVSIPLAQRAYVRLKKQMETRAGPLEAPGPEAVWNDGPKADDED